MGFFDSIKNAVIEYSRKAGEKHLNRRKNEILRNIEERGYAEDSEQKFLEEHFEEYRYKPQVQSKEIVYVDSVPFEKYDDGRMYCLLSNMIQDENGKWVTKSALKHRLNKEATKFARNKNRNKKKK